MDKLIYIAEDDIDIRELLMCSISAFNYNVVDFVDGQQLLTCVNKTKPDMIILDIMMPYIDGMTVIKRLKENSKTCDIPIIMLSAKSGELDKVKCLDLGADDYIVKPFSILELKSRINAVFRRCELKTISNVITVNDITMDIDRYKVFLDNEEIILSKKEFSLLKCLLIKNGSVVTRDDILQDVWGFDFMGETRTLDMHIKTLRQKLKDTDNKKIITIRGVGYKIGE